jgi:peptide/nickel transport system substrate-binding protein
MNQTSLLTDVRSFTGVQTRRTLLKRSVIAMSVPAFASLLAACGGDDDDEPEAPASTPTQASVPTVVTGRASPTATTAASPGAGATPTAAATAPSAETPTVTTSAAGTPKQGGTLTIQGNQEIASLHPDDAGPTVHWVIVANLHDGLVEVDKDYELQGTLAESYEIADDGITYTFQLKQGVPFHDGEEFTSADVKYTFEWYANPDNAAVTGNNFVSLSGVETPDDYTAIMTLKGTDAAFLVLAGITYILPEHYHSEVGKEGYASAPIGTGPFKLKEWKPAEVTTLEAFDDYFRGRPNIDIYQETNVPEESVRTIALETGESLNSVWPLTAEDNLRLMEDDRFNVLRAPALSNNHFPIDNTKPAMAEKEVRQAMMFALNRDRMVDDLEKGLAVKATSNLSPGLQFYYEPDVKQYPYDPDQARALLDAAGWVPGSDGVREKNGQRLSFTCTVITGDQRNRGKAEVGQADLAAVGVEMKIEEAPVASILAGFGTGEVEASIFNWTYGGGFGEPDARTSLKTGAARNFSKYSNPRVDELLDQGVATTDPEERKKIYSEIQKIVAEDVPFLFIMFWEWIEVWSKRVKGLPESIVYTGAPYRLINTFWLEDE